MDTTESILNTFLAPVVNWAEQLFRFFEEKIVIDTNWGRPNRRYPDMYLPSNTVSGLDIDTLTYFVDVSGSVSDYDVQRFNSELKFVKDSFEVGQIRICQFDTSITSVVTLEEHDDLTQVVTVGRGGTDLDCVHRYMEKHKPKSVIIFSDLDCDPLPALSYTPNLLYVVTSNPSVTVEYGSIIHI
jgi:predicted metal-dependent peptidase